MQTLQIEIPKGFEVDSFDKQTGKVTFKPLPKDIKTRIKTFDDVLEYHNILESDFELDADGLTKDEKAYRKLKLIASALNEGWTPDWQNSNWDKYYPWFVMGSSSGVGFSCDVCVGWSSGSHVGSRLCFKSKDLAKYAGKQFEAIYKDFLTLNS